ncbi:MAG: ABC transporter ATP-binding protein [Eubacterium sp.]|nr:ABC transporter ATP-binding protein [Eubacterium sp.]
MITVEIDGVSKSFGNTKLFEDLSLDLEDGKTYALLGRNGSGKTTLMNLMCTKYIPDSGVIKIMDEEAYENEKALSYICFMKDYIPAFEDMRLSAIFKYAEKFYSNWNKELAQQLLKQFNLKKEKIYGLLSKGQQTAVGLIVGLCSNTRVLLLDEIYSGLDAVARKELYTIIMQEQERFPRTLVLSSHLIDEMTNLFTDVLILDDGKIILNDTLDTVQVKARKLTGRKDVDDILSEKNILGKTQVGPMTEIYVYDDISEKELSELRDREYQISSLNLQELFAAMTTK